MNRSHSPRSSRRAAVLVDYANLHALLAERLGTPAEAATRIEEALGELRRYLSGEDDTPTALTTAYADFEALAGGLSGGGTIQRSLYEQGVELRFVPGDPDESAAAVHLATDATALLHQRPDVQTFALVTGDRRAFRPLVRALRREGAHAFVVALDPPPPGDEYAHDSEDVFMDLLNLLSDEARRGLLQGEDTAARREADRPPAPSAAQYGRLDDDMLFRTLEIAEEHFGQYDEVYLTPLLRKLSDVLGERFDPKALVGDLEDAEAVRLEKRRGYPYDYTVLIVNREHPDVQQMEDDFYDGERSAYERGGRPSSSPESDHGDYEDDAYESSDYERESYGSDDFDGDYGDDYEDDHGSAPDPYDDHEAEDDATGGPDDASYDAQDAQDADEPKNYEDASY